MSIDHRLKVPIFTFLGCKGGQIFIFVTPKMQYLVRTTRVARGGVSRDAPCGHGKETKIRTETRQRICYRLLTC